MAIDSLPTRTITSTSSEAGGGIEIAENTVLFATDTSTDVANNGGQLWVTYKPAQHYVDWNAPSGRPLHTTPSWLETKFQDYTGVTLPDSQQIGMANAFKLTETGTYRIKGFLTFANSAITAATDTDPNIPYFFTDSPDTDNMNFGDISDPNAWWDAHYSRITSNTYSHSGDTYYQCEFNDILTVDSRIGGSIEFRVSAFYDGDDITNFKTRGTAYLNSSGQAMVTTLEISKISDEASEAMLSYWGVTDYDEFGNPPASSGGGGGDFIIK